MSYTYLLEQEEESSAECFSDIPASVLSKLNLTLEKSCCSDNETESCQSFQSGTMSQPLMESHGKGTLMSYAEDSLAKTFPSADVAQESMESGLDYGGIWPESFAKYNQSTSLWKTRQLSLFGGLTEFSQTWPQWGIMQDGECLELEVAAVQWNASGFGLPAPTKSMGKKGWGISNIKPRYSAELEANARLFGYKPHPSVLEWSMGWIPTWTRLAPLEMDKFQQWLHSHGKH
jgi:hypothetical protein